MDDLTLWESLDKELNTMVENFSNLIKAARIPDEESDQVTKIASMTSDDLFTVPLFFASCRMLEKRDVRNELQGICLNCGQTRLCTPVTPPYTKRVSSSAQL